MSITSIASKLFAKRQKQLELHYTHGVELQHNILKQLIEKGRETQYCSQRFSSSVKGYEDFAKFIPLNTYEDLKGFIDQMRHGEANVLWPGRVKWYAKSSGTTNDKSKFIPVSYDGLQNIHYKGGKDCVAFYLKNVPTSKMFNGKGLVLGGSHSPNYNVKDSLVGDLSAILIENMHPLVNFIRTPKKSIALLSDFEEKRLLIAKETLKQNITNLSGVPSWMLSVLIEVLNQSGKKDISDVWTNLEVFFHGGIAFNPYREQYKNVISNPNMHYMETYNASEGFFGIQNDLADSSMLLMLDYGVFYEFIPMSEFGTNTPTIIPLEDVQVGVNYAMVITTSCGLWRYVIGDTISFTSVNPYKFVITGRTKYFINAFGEELIMDNAEKGLMHACMQTNAEVKEYTAAPVYMDEKAHCRHQWLIEFSKRPTDIEKFANELDKHLQQINSDYEAKRHNNITLQRLEVIVACEGLFESWLKLKGKLGGQHKVPRLSNERKNIEELISLNTKKL